MNSPNVLITLIDSRLIHFPMVSS